MKNQRKYPRILAFLLCVFLLVTLTACKETTDPSADPSADSTGDETPETPKTDTEKFLDALNAYETYFNNISDDFGTKLPSVSDHGTTELQMTVPVFSVLGEDQMNAFDPEKPFMQATILQAGDLASAVITTMMYGEQIRIETYESATDGYLAFPDLPAQAPIHLPGNAEETVTDSEGAFKKLLDSLEDADTEGVTAPASYLTVAEDEDTCTYSLRLTTKQVVDLLEDMGFDTSSIADDPDSITDGDCMLLDLTTVSGLPTELHITFYDEGETEATAEIILKTSVTGSNTKIDATITSGGETFLTANTIITATQGAIVVNTTTDMSGIKISANVKLFSETESSIMLNGTAEVRYAVDGGAAFTLPLTVIGKLSADGDARRTELEISSSSSGMFDLTMRLEANFTPGETSVTMPEGAVEYEDVDLDALLEALAEAYPQAMGGLIGDQTDYNYRYYVSEDNTVVAMVYDTGFICLDMYALEYVDDGKSLTFFNYSGKKLGSYAYTVISDNVLEIHGMQLYVTNYDDGGKNLYFENEDGDFIWMEIELMDGEAAINFLVPFETVDGVTKLILPDGTPLPFDMVIPEDETSPMKIGSMTFLPYVDTDIV